MQTFHDSLALCRCFHPDRPARPDHPPRLAQDICETEPCESGPVLSLRADVPCLQRWLDLNA